MITRTAAILLGTSLCCMAAPGNETQSSEGKTKWKLVWSDEFNGSSIDTGKWTVKCDQNNHNGEKHSYVEDDVYIEKGCLVLRSQQRPSNGRDYSSGAVHTPEKFFRKFGRFEVRAKLPAGKGMWPAHWIMPISGGWPPEIDIMEMWGKQPRRVSMTNHYTDADGKHQYEEHTFTGPDFTQEFHVFALEWFPDHLAWFVDGQRKGFTKKNVPQEPFYLILNTGIGDWFGNDPGKTTVFPQYHRIDYVRVYEQADAGAPAK